MNQNVKEEDKVDDQVVIDVAPLFTFLHKCELKWDEHRDYNLINQNDGRVDQVYSTKRWKKACGGYLSLNIAFNLRLFILQDRFKLCFVVREAWRYHLIDKKWLLVVLLEVLKREVARLAITGVNELGLSFVNGHWICLGVWIFGVLRIFWKYRRYSFIYVATGALSV